MRKHIVIPTLVLAIVFLVGAYYLSHRTNVTVPIARLPKTPVKPSIRSSRTEVVSAGHSVRPQTALVFPESRQTDVRFGVIRTIIDLKADILTRQKAARALPRNLSPDNRKPLMAFLAAAHAEDSGQAGHVLKNDIMDALVGQSDPDRGLAQLLVGIYQDTAQNSVIRDYALQHLALLSQQLDGPIAWDASLVQTQQKLIQDTLWQAAEARDSSMAGTALLGLTQISETHPELDRTRLGQAAIAMADANVDEAARVTAFQVCARLHVSDALPVTVKAAETDSSSIVRTSAIGALGLFGNADDIPILNQIASDQCPVQNCGR